MLTARHPIVQEDLEGIVAENLPWPLLSEKTVLISGANGFLPAYMLETLMYLNETVKAGIHVVALVRNHEKAMRRLGHLAGRPDLTIVVQDVGEPYKGPAKPHFVIHAASQATPKLFGPDPVGTFEANVSGTRRMLEVAKKAESEAFLFFSSGEVYGRVPDNSIPVTESAYGYLDPIDIRSCYAEGKRAGETLCSCWHAQFGVAAKIARISHTYGPGMDLDDGRVFADLVSDVVAGRDIVLKSDGSARRPFCYLADATAGFFTVLLKGKSCEAYNVGTEVECSISDLADTLCRLFPDRKCKVIRQKREAGDAYIVSPIAGGHFDITKIRQLGWEPKTGLEEGFKRTVQSYDSSRPLKN